MPAFSPDLSASTRATRAIAALLVAILVATLAAVIVRTAWVGDDAYITFRTIDNFLHGYGLRWNVTERVDSFTHPLWLFVLVPIVAVTHNPYLSSMGVSALLTLATAVMFVVALRSRPWLAVLVLASMVLSKSFTDYATSGLENALSQFLFSIVLWASLTPVTTRRRALAIGVLVALISLTRLDLTLMAGTIGLGMLRRPKETLPAFACGGLLLVAWEIFSIVYYGVPFPNTAYAKLGTGTTHAALLIQGLSYYTDSLSRDPVTLFVIAVGVLSACRKDLKALVPGAAVGLYLLYILWIGGDFMSGRFFSAPFVVSLWLIGRAPWGDSWAARLAPIAAVAALGLTVPWPTVFVGAEYRTPWTEVNSPTGIADERGFYFPLQGFRTTTGYHAAPVGAARIQMTVDKLKAANPHAYARGAVGVAGYLNGPGTDMVDIFALCDPLLARLPALANWRIGHYERALPDGYLASVAENRNLVTDPRIASLYEVIRIVTRDPIWSVRRWRAIVALNTGRTAGWAPAPQPAALAVAPVP